MAGYDLSGSVKEVEIVDCDVHPYERSVDQLREYAPKGWEKELFPSGREISPAFLYYDPPDYVHARSMRYDAVTPSGDRPGSDPDFATEQLLDGAGIDIAMLQPIPVLERLPEADHARRVTTNNWLADVWLDKHNAHGRWRGAISVSMRDPVAGAREIERWAGHPYMCQVLMCPQSRVSFGDPWFDPIYEAASRHELPVATHVMGLGPFEFTPLNPVGNQTHWHDFLPSWSLLYVSHLMSLVFDGTFEKFPNLRVVFTEGAFSWVLPTMWRMDAYWRARRSDVPWVKRSPSEYVKEHVRFTTQPLEEPPVSSDYKEYLGWMDVGSLLMFSSDYPHWSYDAPHWASRFFPRSALNAIMRDTAIELYRLPRTVLELTSRDSGRSMV